MRRRLSSHNLGGAKAAILHRPHATVTALSRQLAAIGLEVETHWPELGPGALAVDFVFFDADLGYDDQFPWSLGQSPMPMIALLGSEAPGRIEWSLRAGATAQLMKPVGDSGVYAALLIARDGFEAQQTLRTEIATLRDRIEHRQTIVRAVALLAARGKSQDDAYDQLRQMAMAWRVTIEEAARRLVSDQGEGRLDQYGNG